MMGVDRMKKVVIVGGGPAGMLASIACKQRYPDVSVILLERNDRLGVKLRLTGGGRCNLTADVDQETVVKHIPQNGRFLYSALTLFNPRHIQDFFMQHGCELKVEDHHRVFPKSNKAGDVVATLIKVMDGLGIEIRYHQTVTDVDINQRRVTTVSSSFDFDYLILATGGISYAHTGSDQLGFDLIAKLGHTVTPLLPAEVPLVSNDMLIQSKEWQGLSFRDVTITGLVNGKKKVSITHDLLFTHFGLSGPGPLQVSSYLVKDIGVGKDVTVLIDFLPKVSFEQLAVDFKEKGVEQTLKENGISKRVIQYWMSRYSFDQIVTACKRFEVKISDRRGFMNAFVTCGGVSVKEIVPKTMKSKIHPNVAICGEALDLNGSTGGYNMTIAFSSGYSAGWYICEDDS